MRIGFLTFAAVVVGCDVGSVAPFSPDAGGGGGSGQIAQGACTPPSTNQPNGNHYPGMDCLTCHDGQTAGATAFTVAGTLFASGSTPLAGASVLVTDSTNKSFTLVTASNGNFYSSDPVTLPLTALGVSDCSAFASGLYMNSEMPVAATGSGSGAQGASCNNCHIAGQDAPPLHLP
jgi:ABC-type phosphate transport system substrate-binding protein